MTTEIEKEFLDAFGIKAKRVRPFYCNKNQKNIPCEFCIEEHGKCLSQREIYPEITDRILLELIEIIIKRDLDVLKLYKFKGSYHGQFDTNNDAYFANYQQNTFKDLILHICEQNSKIFYHQVRELFGEGEEE